MRPDLEIAGIAAAQATLDRALDGLTEDDLARPSLLPEWSVAHVLAHLTRNADSVVRQLQGAIDGEVVDQYVGGASGRAAEIEQSAHLPLDELRSHIRSSSAEVERLCAAMPDDAWDRRSRSHGGSETPATYVVYSRWREVEIHHVDMGLGYTPADWPEALVSTMLPEILADLPRRTDAAQLLAWLLGRAVAPTLQSWR